MESSKQWWVQMGALNLSLGPRQQDWPIQLHHLMLQESIPLTIRVCAIIQWRITQHHYNINWSKNSYSSQIIYCSNTSLYLPSNSCAHSSVGASPNNMPHRYSTTVNEKTSTMIIWSFHLLAVLSTKWTGKPMGNPLLHHSTIPTTANWVLNAKTNGSFVSFSAKKSMINLMLHLQTTQIPSNLSFFHYLQRKATAIGFINQWRTCYEGLQ